MNSFDEATKEKPLDNELLKKRLADNLQKTFDLIQLQHGLKFALYKKLYPSMSDEELQYKICMDNIKRKEAAWKHQKT